MNPFNPSFGYRPERFIGRDTIVHEVLSATKNLNSPWRSTLLTGVRGSGKTALLSDIQKKLQDSDTIVVSITPNVDFLNELLSQMYDQIPTGLLAMFPKLKSIDSGIGLSFQVDDKEAPPYYTQNFRYQITLLLREMKKNHLKVILLIDETQKHSEDMRTFVSTYQHLIREGYDINLVMAGLPHVIADILNDDILTFLRRAKRVELQNVDISLIHLSYFEVFKEKYSAALIRKAANFTRGFPYLFQLVGYYLWEATHQYESEEYAFEVVEVQAKVDLYQNVHQLIFIELSEKDKEFLCHMNLTGEETNISDMLTRLEKNKGYISLYRQRLLSAGLIKSLGYGKIGFTLPYMGDFLKEKIVEMGADVL